MVSCPRLFIMSPHLVVSRNMLMEVDSTKNMYTDGYCNWSLRIDCKNWALK